jgi:hypothetical protein
MHPSSLSKIKYETPVYSPSHHSGFFEKDDDMLAMCRGRPRRYKFLIPRALRSSFLFPLGCSRKNALRGCLCAVSGCFKNPSQNRQCPTSLLSKIRSCMDRCLPSRSGRSKKTTTRLLCVAARITTIKHRNCAHFIPNHHLHCTPLQKLGLSGLMCCLQVF